MNNFGGWAMAQSTYEYICSILPKGKTILEIGSGFGTGQMAKYYKMYSIEATLQWINRFDSTYIYAPIKMYNDSYPFSEIPDNKGWHDHEILAEALSTIEYDLIFIDGPEGKYGRGGFLKHINLFNTNVPMVFDDVNRPAELALIQKVSKLLDKPYSILQDKITGVI